MSLLVPAALALAALAVPLVALYMLRARRHRRVIPSTMLWEESLESVSSARPWQRLPISWPLILQLLILALFVLVLARPFISERTVLGPHTVFVIDISGSMGMAGRFESARDNAIELAQRASDENLISVVAAGVAPDVRVSFSGESEVVVAALESLEPGGGVADLHAAIRTARSLATPDRPTSLLLFSDGGDPERVQFDTPIVDARHLVSDQLADNVAISSLSVDVVPGEGAQVFIEVQNLTLTRTEIEGVVDVDGVPSQVFLIETEAGGRGRDAMTVEAGAGSVIEARLIDENGNDLDDGLDMDNRATGVVATAPELTVAVEGDGSVFLNALLQSTPGTSVEVDGDIVVADGMLPETFDRPTWLIRPPAPAPGLALGGLVQNTAVTYQRPGEPILDGADLSDVVIGEAQIVDGPDWLPIVSAGDVPLVLLGEVDGVRVVYTAFDLTQSNLPVQVAFPILGSRILHWLAGDDIAPPVVAEAGAPILLTGSSTETPIISRPDGSRIELRPGTILFSDTERPGLYGVSYRAADGTVRLGAAEVRAFASIESLGASQELPVTPPELGVGGEGSSIREVAPLLLLLVLLFFAIEWRMTHRRQRTARVRDDPAGHRPLVDVGRPQ